MMKEDGPILIEMSLGQLTNVIEEGSKCVTIYECNGELEKMGCVTRGELDAGAAQIRVSDPGLCMAATLRWRVIQSFCFNFCLHLD